ncbi:MAG TPA: hypothetical protein VF062_22615 [Candidatus Limnocylindrales bacterium]
MGMQLPGEVRDFLSIVGFEWPAGDETKLLDLGQTWTQLSGMIDRQVDQAQQAAQLVWDRNASDMVDRFREMWGGGEGPAGQMTKNGTGGDVIGMGLMVCAGIVLALKINVIVQVTLTIIQIAAAIAAAFVSFGASAAVVPLLREACKRLLDYLLDQAIGKVLNG